jgi:hypothetical protein
VKHFLATGATFAQQAQPNNLSGNNLFKMLYLFYDRL